MPEAKYLVVVAASRMKFSINLEKYMTNMKKIPKQIWFQNNSVNNNYKIKYNYAISKAKAIRDQDRFQQEVHEQCEDDF